MSNDTFARLLPPSICTLSPLYYRALLSFFTLQRIYEDYRIFQTLHRIGRLFSTTPLRRTVVTLHDCARFCSPSPALRRKHIPCVSPKNRVYTHNSTSSPLGHVGGKESYTLFSIDKVNRGQHTEKIIGILASSVFLSLPPDRAGVF